ncbi:MAG: tryptophan synthase subunit alpha [Bacteroidetes bacterium]|nr:tryptophan synthase subunit alpha [Bacteroidota bacterium]
MKIKKQLKGNRIAPLFHSLKEKNNKALTLFITAGYPKKNSTVPLALRIAESGADIIELGMPFSDPLADGPVIQTSSQQAIKNGITLKLVLAQVKEIRKHCEIPLILMGYLNPILHYGENKFFADAKKAGIDGIILPEVPLEESARFLSLNRKYNLADILFVSPATPEKRIREIDKTASGFIYCVSTTGVTGKSNIGNIGSYIKRVKKNAVKNPVLVGFGIKTPADARNIARHADGIIIGSALIKKITQKEPLLKIGKWAADMKRALH